MIVEHSTKQIIGRSQSVHVTCKMEVDVLHRYHLCIAATCCSTLYSKYWPKGRFSQGDDCFFADFRHGLSKTCCCSGFAFPCWGWIDCCHQDQFAIFLILQAIIQRIVQFCLISSIRLQLLFANTKRSGDPLRWVSSLSAGQSRYPSAFPFSFFKTARYLFRPTALQIIELSKLYHKRAK